MDFYNKINAIPNYMVHTVSSGIAADWHYKLDQLWEFATGHARRICKETYEMLHSSRFPKKCYDALRQSSAWKTYSTRHQRSVLAIGLSFLSDCSTVAQSRFEALLRELEDTASTIEHLRTRFLLDYWYDPIADEVNRFIWVQETSDSCNTDEDSADQYGDMRRRLEQFYNDDGMTFIKTGPILRHRMRKDIRAWARLARCSCVKLSCGSMLIHKSKIQLPHRRRKTLQPDSRKHSMSGMAYYDAADTGYYDDGDPSYYDAVDTDYYHPPACYDVTRNARYWQPREPNAGYSSADSNDSCASNMSATTASKKRRLEKVEGGYVCDFEACGRAFDRQCDLTHHRRSHQPKDERPYGCEGCGQRFVFPKDLRRHARSCREAGTSEDF